MPSFISCGHSVDMEEELLIEKVCDLYHKISSLESLKPCHNVDTLFTQLVLTCIPPNPIDVSNLPQPLQDMRSKLIRLCGQAESLLETHYSNILASYQNPLHHLHIFPYYSNYINLALLDFTILTQHSTHLPSTIAFVGSGPLPFTSIVLASNHLPTTTFHNYDVDPLANSMARRLFCAHPDLSNRMLFHTTDIMDVTTELKEYEVVYLAALVGMDKEEKTRIIEHLGKYMAPGAFLMLRSAHGARAFLYPVVHPSDLQGFELLTVFHPTDEQQQPPPLPNNKILSTKCSDQIQLFNPLINHEEFAIEEQSS
ncbi:nicotianamine synthase [Senna tora]|uniref:Nicotianamine synthase n=1 Tax=Senna tora TaxID=362788 RepID=A0A834WG08_9FABA|nr:nicotianamine synthase [Senna tora]